MPKDCIIPPIEAASFFVPIFLRDKKDIANSGTVAQRMPKSNGSNKFKEGQADQVLDTLFYDFIDLAKKLQPKIVIAENVTGILKGNARDYVRGIMAAFDDAGYLMQEFELDSSQMGVPQKRERVFFIAIRRDLAELLPRP
jgi:site-specific DNA-cytosine methylase